MAVWSTTEAKVVEILNADGNYSDGATVLPFMDTAEMVITDNCLTSGYSDGLLELIHRWLSGYYYLLMNPVAKFRSAGKVQESLESKIDLGFFQNKYGMAAMQLDYKGNLAALNNQTKNKKMPTSVSVTWLGTEPE